jgi:peptidoglycan/LPS O-acetylase OafA/YrhL
MVDQRRSTAPVHPAAPAAPGASSETGRVAGLDGLRGLAALYVLVHHCWLFSFHGYPRDTGPLWLGWLLYGHLGVVFFIVLSGFSLGIAPARHGWRLGGVARYARRRAQRILPAYWAALAFSLVVAWAVIPQPHSAAPDAETVGVYGLLLQDFVAVPVPNGAFWSIAVEAELYLLLPVLLLVRRRAGAVTMLAVVAVPVLAYGLRHPDVSTVDRLTWLTPQFAPVFAMGLLGAGVVAGNADWRHSDKLRGGAGERVRRMPWQWLALAAAAPVAVASGLAGTVWTVHHYFWVDLAIAPAIAALLAAVATGRPAPLVWLLDTRPVRDLGSFSYSLYLIHLPIVVVVSRVIVPWLAGPGLPAFGLPAFGVTLALAAPLAVLAARLFAKVFELPFLPADPASVRRRP